MRKKIYPLLIGIIMLPGILLKPLYISASEEDIADEIVQEEADDSIIEDQYMSEEAVNVSSEEDVNGGNDVYDSNFEYESLTQTLKIKTSEGLTQFKNGSFPDTRILKLYIRTNNDGVYDDAYVALPDRFAEDRINLEEVEINKGFERLGVASFKGCTSLTKIIIQGNANLSAGIPDECFSGCTRLTNFGINLNTPLVIGKRAFYGTSVTSLVLNNAQTVGDEAFGSCERLTRISMANATAIGKDVLKGCTALTDIAMDSLTAIPEGMFADCSNLKTSSFKKATTVGDRAFKGCENMTTITLNETSGESNGYIGEEAFMDCKKITTIKFVGIKTLKKRAFKGCVSLQTIDLGDLETIYEETFDGCTNLEKVTAYNLLHILDRAFAGCKDLYIIPLNNVLTFGDRAFAGCTGLSQVNATKAQNVGKYVFQNCTRLDNVAISGISANSIGVFNACENIKLANIKLNDGYASIPNSLFDGLLLAEDSPTGKDVIKEMALVAVSVNAEYIEKIGDRAFANCTALQNQPEKFKTCYNIGHRAFENCKNLREYQIEKVSISDNSARAGINSYAFNNCERLDTFISYVPVNKLEPHAFNGCKRLDSVIINCDDLTISQSVFKNAFTQSTGASIALAGNVVEIEPNAFDGAKRLDKFIISTKKDSDGLIIDEYAISNCNKLTEFTVYEDLNIYTPEELEYLKNPVKKNDQGETVYKADGTPEYETEPLEPIYEKNLKNGTIMASGAYGTTLSLGYGSFMISRNYDDKDLQTDKRHNYSANGLDDTDLIVNLGKVDNLTIPTSCFMGGNLKRLKYTGDIGDIYASAFYYCHRLTEFDDNGDKDKGRNLGENAFANCMNLKELTLTTSILPGNPGSMEFTGKYEDGDKTKPIFKEKEAKNTFGSYAFSGCDKLETLKLNLSDDITAIPEGMVYAFYKENLKYYEESSNNGSTTYEYEIESIEPVSVLKKVTINGGKECQIVHIGVNAFGGNYKLTEIPSNLLKKVYHVGNYAFSGCAGIESFDFPVEKDEIRFDDMAFSSCKGLATITVKSPVCIGKRTFTDTGVSTANGTTYNIPVITAVGNYAFYGSKTAPHIFTITGSSKYSDKANIIGQYAFSDIKAPMEVTFGEAVYKADDSCFENCTGLTKANVEILKEIGNRAFTNTGLTDVTLNAAIIGEGAMSNCISLEKLTVSDSVTQVGELAFTGDVRLKEIYIGTGVTDLTPFSLPDLTVLEKMTIMGNSAGTTIPDGLMRTNTSLKTLILGDNVVKIGNYAFYGCKIDEIKIPKRCKEIGDFAFAQSSNLNKIILTADNTALKRIGTNAFSECSALETLTIPAIPGLEIGDSAFYKCSQLKTITLAEGLIKIGKNAFVGTAIERIDLPESLLVLEKDAFTGCLNLIEVRFNNKQTQVYNSSGTIPGSALIYTKIDTKDFGYEYLTPYLYALRYSRVVQKQTEEYGSYTPPEPEAVAKKVTFESKTVRVPSGGCEIVLKLSAGCHVTDIDSGWTLDKKTLQNQYVKIIGKGSNWIRIRTNDDPNKAIRATAKVTANAKVINSKGREVHKSATARVIIENPVFKRGATSASGVTVNDGKQPFVIKVGRTKPIKIGKTGLSRMNITYDIVSTEPDTYISLRNTGFPEQVSDARSANLLPSHGLKSLKIKGKKTTTVTAADGTVSDKYVKIKAILSYPRGNDENGDPMDPYVVERYAMIKIQALNKNAVK